MVPAYVVRWHVGFFPTTALEAGILLTFAAFAFESIRDRALPDWRSPLTIPAALLLLAGAISIIVAPSRLAALGIYRAYFVEPIAFALVLVSVLRTYRQAQIVVLGAISGATVLGVVNSTVTIRAFLNHSFDPVLAPQLAPPVAIYTAANAIALYLVPLIALVAAMLLHEKDRSFRVVWGIFVAIATLSVLLTFSRGGWAALAVVAIGLILSLRRRRLWLGGLASGALLFLLVPGVAQRLQADLTFGPNQTLDGRIPLWEASLRMLAQRTIFGAGISGFADRMRTDAGDYPNILTFPHNIALNFWSETGLLGVVAFTAIVVVVVVVSWRGWRSGTADWRPVHMGVLLAMAAILMHGLVDVPYFKNDLAFEFWLLVGLTFAGRRAALKRTS
jgi:putative inorganic carbon (hco3(-)) transporter